MKPSLRLPIGKTAITGYLVLPPQQEGFFEPGEQERPLRLEFGSGQHVEARLVRAGGRSRRLKIAYTGATGAALRAWLRARFRSRPGNRPWGILVLRRLGDSRLELEAESLRQARFEHLALSGRRYYLGARPISVLHPALLDLAHQVERVALAPAESEEDLRHKLESILVTAGWQPGDSVGGGLALSAGLRRTGAQLHLVLRAADLYPALLASAVAFELRTIDLALLLVADERLSARLAREAGVAAAGPERAEREIDRLDFLVRGPTCVFGLSRRAALR